MIGQLSFGNDGKLRDKVQTAIDRLKAFEPPELVRFIKTNYPDVQFERQHDKNGKPITMWSLIAEHTLPPTRKVRYCCSALKETGGQGRVVVTGVRWAESANRKNTHDVVDIRGKKAKKKADAMGVEYKQNKHGDVILNDDNDDSRRMVEQCYRTHKTMVNPIVDWTDEDVWDFLNSNGIPHCSLYDEGFTRLGCIGCPLSGSKNMIRDFERWPKYKELYIRAFQRMIDNHPGEIRILNPNGNTKFKLVDEMTENSIGGQEHTLLPQQTLSDGTSSGGVIAEKSMGGGTLVSMVDGVLPIESSISSSETATDDKNLTGGGTNSQGRCLFDGSKRRCAEYVFGHWLEMGAT